MRLSNEHEDARMEELDMLELLKEAKDLDVFKKLLNVLGEYSDRYPATGAGKMFKEALEAGGKAVPKDKQALCILNKILSDKQENVPARVHKLVNLRFSDLPFDCRPIYKSGNANNVAFWLKDGKVYDRVISLLNLGADAAKGSWSDMSGGKVSLIDRTVEERLTESVTFDNISQVMYTESYDGFWVANQEGDKEFIGQNPQIRQMLPEDAWTRAMANAGEWLSVTEE